MKLIYEFIGTFFLVFTIGMTVIEPGGAGALAPIAIGAVLAVMVYVGGAISGAHYNPAVTFAVFLRKKIAFDEMVKYIITQMLAGIIAAFFVIFFKADLTTDVMQLAPVAAIFAEFLFTFALCFVIFNVTSGKSNAYFGFAIGFIVLVGAFAVGSISGAAFNPAVAFSLSIMGLFNATDLWILLTGNLLGAAAAAYMFNLFENQAIRKSA